MFGFFSVSMSSILRVTLLRSVPKETLIRTSLPPAAGLAAAGAGAVVGAAAAAAGLVGSAAAAAGLVGSAAPAAFGGCAAAGAGAVVGVGGAWAPHAASTPLSTAAAPTRPAPVSNRRRVNRWLRDDIACLLTYLSARTRGRAWLPDPS